VSPDVARQHPTSYWTAAPTVFRDLKFQREDVHGCWVMLTTLQCTDTPTTKNCQAKISGILRLRNPQRSSSESLSHWWHLCSPSPSNQGEGCHQSQSSLFLQFSLPKSSPTPPISHQHLSPSPPSPSFFLWTVKNRWGPKCVCQCVTGNVLRSETETLSLVSLNMKATC
jgi:hypothetical protein